MLLIALAIAPGLAISIYMLYRDNYNREPALNMVMSFVWGALATVPAFGLEYGLAAQDSPSSLGGILLKAYLAVALVEEGCKFLVLRFYCYNLKSFDEPLDGIVYGVLAGMGFATLENIGYVLLDEDGYTTGFLRMFTSVPAHAIYAIIMGYHVGKARFDPLRRRRLMARGLLGAALLHGTYDAFLLLTEYNWLEQYVSDVLLLVGAVGSLYIALFLSRKLVRQHRATSLQLFQSVPVLTIRHASEEDIKLIRNLALQIWPGTYATILEGKQIAYMMQLIYSPAALKQQMRTERHQFIIVYNAGLPIGFASYSEITPAVYKLHKIYLHPQQQGRGTGRFVIGQIISDIRPKGAAALRLNVNRHNPARAFYEKLGFIVIREEDIDIGEGYYMNDYVMELKIDDR